MLCGSVFAGAYRGSSGGFQVQLLQYFSGGLPVESSQCFLINMLWRHSDEVEVLHVKQMINKIENHSYVP